MALVKRLVLKSLNLFRQKQFEGRRRSDSFLYHSLLPGESTALACVEFYCLFIYCKMAQFMSLYFSYMEGGPQAMKIIFEMKTIFLKEEVLCTGMHKRTCLHALCQL